MSRIYIKFNIIEYLSYLQGKILNFIYNKLHFLLLKRKISTKTRWIFSGWQKLTHLLLSDFTSSSSSLKLKTSRAALMPLFTAVLILGLKNLIIISCFVCNIYPCTLHLFLLTDWREIAVVWGRLAFPIWHTTGSIFSDEAYYRP